MRVKHKLVTAEELLTSPEVPGMNLELVDGEVVEVSPTNIRHGLIATMLAGRLDEFVQKHDLGLVMGDNVGYVLRRDPDTVRAPDVSFAAWNSAPQGDDLDRFVEGPPTLAVEIVSPSDRANDIHAKVRAYLQAGTRLVWVLWPDTQSATAYDADGGVRELGSEAELDGGDVLPGFTVRVGDLFDVRRRPQ